MKKLLGYAVASFIFDVGQHDGYRTGLRIDLFASHPHDDFEDGRLKDGQGFRDRDPGLDERHICFFGQRDSREALNSLGGGVHLYRIHLGLAKVSKVFFDKVSLRDGNAHRGGEEEVPVGPNEEAQKGQTEKGCWQSTDRDEIPTSLGNLLSLLSGSVDFIDSTGEPRVPRQLDVDFLANSNCPVDDAFDFQVHHGTK